MGVKKDDPSPPIVNPAIAQINEAVFETSTSIFEAVMKPINPTPPTTLPILTIDSKGIRRAIIWNPSLPIINATRLAIYGIVAKDPLTPIVSFA